jgi:hypothetical protein
MHTSMRRAFLRIVAGVAVVAAAPRRVWPTSHRPSVGAIRWDAWYDPEDGRVAQAMETALGAQEYHDRMPFFGRELGPDSVRIDGYSQEVLDQEIASAARAGLDYWAFVGYAPSDPMTNALNLYLSSTRRGDIGFCMIGTLANGGSRDHVSDRTVHELAMMGETGYVKLLDGRPLYYLLIPAEKQIELEWGGNSGVADMLALVRATALERRFGNPYIVLLGASAGRARAMGGDAIGAYAIVGDPVRSPYAKLAEDTKARWNQLAGTGIDIVVTAMTGWDQRPLIEHPPYWDLSYMKKGVGLEKYYQRAMPSEIAQHLQDAISWTEGHRSASPSYTVLVYAWNECGEGFGALIPTYQPGNQLGDQSRLNAVGRVLRR